MIEIGENFISVTSDTDSRHALVISTQHGDVFLEVSDEKPDDDSVFIEPIRFIDPEQGAQLPALTAGLRDINRSLREVKGQIQPSILDYDQVARMASLPDTLQVRTSDLDSEPRIEIYGITDDGADFGRDMRWLDIAISHEGDATLTFRGIGFDP